MRCYSCSRLSFSSICQRCKERFFQIQISKRTIGTMEVISFYRYSTLEPLLLTKYTPEGYRIYKTLGQMTMKPFIETFSKNIEGRVYIIGIDESVKSGYAHVALLTHTLKTANIKPLHSVLMAQNRVHYAGKTLAFRLEHPREFSYTGKKNIDAILVDDIITTGITLQEAQHVLMLHGVNVLFALTLANAEE